jgi:putative oxygen-independent coproporphyrinogen III oxidase
MVNAIGKEIALTTDYLQAKNIDSIYFGGGTPSVLTKEELNYLLDQVRSHYSFADKIEITLEANPDDMHMQFLENCLHAGINRLSVGVQSFRDHHLQYMNRVHNAAQTRQALTNAVQVGFKELSVDLIYGYPNLADEEWLDNLAQLKELNITHLSCYALTVEPGTALHHQIKNKTIAPVNEDQALKHFELLVQWAEKNEWEHYEISNLSKKGHRAIHNSNYWQAEKYLGLGPGAHSFDGDSRRWNVANNALYQTSINKNEIPFEQEILTEFQKANEYIMTTLRTSDGINLARLEALIPNQFGKWMQGLNEFKKHLVQTQTHVKLSKDARFLADGIAADLFLEM